MGHDGAERDGGDGQRAPRPTQMRIGKQRPPRRAGEGRTRGRPQHGAHERDPECRGNGQPNLAVGREVSQT